MKDVIYLRVSRRKVEAMTKSMPGLYKGDIPVKLTITVDDKAFREPVIEQTVEINDWQEGIDIADVELKQSVITPEEAALIRERRLDKMREILQENGYTVSKEDESGEAENE